MKAKLHEALLSADWIHEGENSENSISRKIMVEESSSEKDLIEELQELPSTSNAAPKKIFIEEVNSLSVPLEVAEPQKKVLIEVIENKEDELNEELEEAALVSSANKVLIEEIDSVSNLADVCQKNDADEVIENQAEETNKLSEETRQTLEGIQNMIVIEEASLSNNSTDTEKNILIEVIEDNEEDTNKTFLKDSTLENSKPSPLEEVEAEKIPEALKDTTEIEKGTLDDLIKEKDTKYETYLKRAEEEILPNIAHFSFNLEKSENVNENKTLIEEIDNIIQEEASGIDQMHLDVKKEIDNIITTAINTIEKNSPLDENQAMAILDHGIQMVDLLNNIGKLPIIPQEEMNNVNTDLNEQHKSHDENSISEISNAGLPTDENDVALDETFDESKETNMADLTFQSCTNDDTTSNITSNPLNSSKTEDDSDNYVSFDNDDDEDINEFVATTYEKNIISSLELQVSNTTEEAQE